MTNNKQKLELTWIGKDEQPKLEPRILIEDPEKSYGDPNSQNMLIHGDNLLALKALEQDFIGKIKCIAIDPPYNTGNAYPNYNDNKPNSDWLHLLHQRIEIMHNLLTEDGVLFVIIDEEQHAYLKILIDGIFGRENYLGDLIWKKRKGGGNDSRYFAIDHDYIIVHAKNASKEIHKAKWRVSQTEEYLKRYREIDEEGDRYYWDTLARDGLQNPIPVNIECPDGTTLFLNSQKSEKTIKEGLVSGQIRLSQTQNGWSLHHRVYMPEGQVLRSILDNVGTNKTAGDEMEYLFGNNKAFDYPKPESLMKVLIELVTKPNDIVMDSFLGSGTTSAVALKMGRRWIGIELGDHCDTHCLPRLKKVVDGTDQVGISKTVNWTGGGGFKYYYLAPSLLKKDKYKNWVIEPEYNADMLSAAMAKHGGFLFHPDETIYWKQGKSTEKDYIFTTTSFVTIEMLDSLHEELLPEESLLICCKAFQEACTDRYPNITIKKIPNMLLGKCEFGKEDYSLNIINIPMESKESELEDFENEENDKTIMKFEDGSLFDSEVK